MEVQYGIATTKDLRNKIFIVLGLLLLTRVLAHVPIAPGNEEKVNPRAVSSGGGADERGHPHRPAATRG